MALEMFAGICVRDFTTAQAWYERLLGVPPSFLPHATEAVWELAEQRSLYIVENADRAGNAVLTVLVDDLDARVDGAASRGLEPVLSETYDEQRPQGDLPGRGRQRDQLRGRPGLSPQLQNPEPEEALAQPQS